MSAAPLWTPPLKLWVAEHLRASHRDLQHVAWHALAPSTQHHFLDEAEKAIRAVAMALRNQRDGTDPFRPDANLAVRIDEGQKPGAPL